VFACQAKLGWQYNISTASRTRLPCFIKTYSKIRTWTLTRNAEPIDLCVQVNHRFIVTWDSQRWVRTPVRPCELLRPHQAIASAFHPPLLYALVHLLGSWLESNLAICKPTATLPTTGTEHRQQFVIVTSTRSRGQVVGTFHR
jgi:hypothetical protein